jgi:hypothetical protein
MSFVELGACETRHDFDRRGPRLRSQHAVQDPSGVPAVFSPVGGIDFVVDAVVRVDECDVLVNTTGPYPTLVVLLGTTEPMSIAPSN